MSSRRSSLNRPTSISGKRVHSPPSLDYAARPHIGSGSTSNTTPMHAARGGLVNMQDFQATEQFSLSSRTNWNVDDGTLRPLPSLHPPLDPASSAFVGDASPSVIAARVSDCLRERSIMTQFDDDTATASAMTANRVRFMIRLYRGGAPSTPFAHGVIVDIQRLRGDVVTFHQSSRAILSAAQGDAFSTRLYSNMLPNHGMGLALDTQFAGTPVARGRPKQDDHSEVLSAIEIDWSLIKKDRMDANILGWESLALLTSEQGSDQTTALITGRVLLGLAPSGNEEDEGEDERHAEIHAALITLVRDRRMLGGDAVYDIDDDNSNHEGKNDTDYLTAEERATAQYSPFPEDREHITVQRSLAIRSLANALEVVANAGDTRFLENALPHLVQNENIVPSLLQEVAESVQPNNPFNASDATHAARALRVLFEHSQDARNIAHSLNALNVLSKATTVGRSRHAALEQEAGRAFQILNGGGLSLPPGVDLSSP